MSARTRIVIVGAVLALTLPAGPARAAIWDEDAGLAFFGHGYAQPTAYADGLNAMHGRSAVQLSGSDAHACIIDIGAEVVCWGASAHGQLGSGGRGWNTPGGPAATYTGGALEGVPLTSVTAGGHHTCALDAAGSAYCWGLARDGQTGVADADRTLVFPQPVDRTGGRPFRQISAGDVHTCAVDRRGRAYCWGKGSQGRLGTGSTASEPVPVPVDRSGVLTNRSLVAIDAGDEHTCAVAEHGAVYCWGKGADGQLGSQGSRDSRLRPVRVQGTGPQGVRFVQVSAGAEHTCGVTSDDQVYCWGSNTSGQLGTEVGDSSAVPRRVRGLSAVNVSAGWQHTCAIGLDDTTYCWGDNWHGQLGNGNHKDQNRPQPVDATGVLAGTTVVQVSAMRYGTCALGADNRAYCWGGGSFQPWLSGDLPSRVTTPHAVITGTSALEGLNVVDITDGGTNVCALTDTGQAYCSLAYRVGAVDTSGALDGVQLADLDAGIEHVCGLDTAGKAYCWGNGNDGQLGDGAMADSEEPVAVDRSGALAGKTLVDISGGGWHTCALDTDGEAYCWGTTILGSADTSPPEVLTVPTKVSTTGVLSGVTLVDIESAVSHTCAVSDVGDIYCWGDNWYGNLGDGTTTDTLTPVAVDLRRIPATEQVTSLAAGDSATCALTDAGHAYCWGWSSYGQAGTGKDTNRTRYPTAVDTSGVLDGVTLRTLSMGFATVCGLSTDGDAYCWGYGDGPPTLGNGHLHHSNVPVAVTMSGALSGADITLLGVGFYGTWMVTEPE